MYAEPHLNEEYFCTESNLEQASEVVYIEGVIFNFTQKGSYWLQDKAKSMQRGPKTKDMLDRMATMQSYLEPRTVILVATNFTGRWGELENSPTALEKLIEHNEA